MYVYKSIYFALCLKEVVSTLRDFATCHDDFELKPLDGILESHTYKWLGFVLYVHVTTDLPNQSKAPRVVLIHKHFVLGAANDFFLLPKNYKLGNVIFGDYERDEDECSLTMQEIKEGTKCSPAYYETAITEITAHPEYTRFGVHNSLALIKLVRPLKSAYMLPICLPTIDERLRLRRRRVVSMVDYLNSVPLEIETEKMAQRTLKMYSHKDCRRRRIKSKQDGTDILSNALCTTGCGIRSGAVIIRHDSDGMFQLIGLSVGSVPCLRTSMRRRFNKEPPLYIDVYPYVTWITSMINANTMPKPYPANFKLLQADPVHPEVKQYFTHWKGQKLAWRGHTFVVGNSCFRNSKRQKKMAFFYYESFAVWSKPPTRLNIFMKISAGIECTITCARLLLPNHKSTPIIDGIGGFNISVQIETDWLPYKFFFTLRLSGKNSTTRNIDRWWSQRGPGMMSY